MRNILQTIGAVAAVLTATAFIWLVLSAPGFVVDSASTVPLADHREVRR